MVVWNPSAAPGNDKFIRDVLDGASVTAKVVTVGSFDDLRSRVLATPGAIGIAPDGLVVPGVRVPKSPVMASQVIMVTKGEPTPDVKKLLDLLADVDFIL